MSYAPRASASTRPSSRLWSSPRRVRSPALAGAFYAHYVVVLSPQIADFSEMAKLVIMTVVGGLGTFAGPLIGAAPIEVLNSYLAKYGEWDMVIYALAVIALMRANRGGLVELLARFKPKMRSSAR